MERLRLGILGETPYLNRLAECISRNGPEYLEVAQCSGRRLDDFLEQFQADILLRESGTDLSEKLPERAVEMVIADEPGMGEETPPVIFRYQQGEEILRQIFVLYQQAAVEMPACWCRTRQMDMVAVYAPGGHEQQLLFSIAYAAACGEMGKVLYLNLAEFSGMLAMMGDKEGENFSDLIYGIRQRKEWFPAIFQGVLHHAEKFDYVQPPGNARDLYEIEARDIESLLEQLENHTEYQVTVWNCTAFHPLTDRLLSHCSQVICLVRENLPGRCRKEDFERYLDKEEGKWLRDKVQYVCPAAGSVSGSAGELMIQLQSSEMAAQARELARLRRGRNDTGDGTAEAEHTDTAGFDKGEYGRGDRGTHL